MQGYQVKAYVGAQVHQDFQNPIHSDKIVKSWVANRKQAEAERNKMAEKYDDAIIEIE